MTSTPIIPQHPSPQKEGRLTRSVRGGHYCARITKLSPKRLAADTAYGTGRFLAFVTGAGIPAHPRVGQEQAGRRHVFARRNVHICPAGETLRTSGRIHSDHAIRYFASVPRCRECPLKQKCCPNMSARRIVRSANEAARDIARRQMKTKPFLKSRDQRKRVEMRFDT